MGKKCSYIASSRIWAPFHCFPIQYDSYYSFEPADKVLLRKGGNSTWVDEYRQVSTVNSCEWWQKAQEIVRHEKCVLNLLPKEQNPAPFGWRQFQKKPKPGEKKKKKRQTTKTRTKPQRPEHDHSSWWALSLHTSRELGFFDIRSVYSSLPSTRKIILPSCQCFYFIKTG